MKFGIFGLRWSAPVYVRPLPGKWVAELLDVGGSGPIKGDVSHQIYLHILCGTG